MQARTPRLLAVVFAAAAAASQTIACAAEPAGWKAGVATVVITPEHLMWMSGYSSRDHAAEGKLHDLWAKALVLEDPSGERAALVTVDLVGIGRALSLSVRDALKKKYGLAKPQVAINCSHTHTGPVVGHNSRTMYFLDEQQSRLVDEYTARLEKKIVAVVGEAIKNLAPAALSWGGGETSFAVNRRNNPEAEVPALAAAGKLKGPVDHQVPVLAVKGTDGKLKAVVFGYACHATTLASYQWSGDWPGFAIIDLEKQHPGTVAMFWAGCGADQNPIPRRSVELAEKYGHEMAQAVDQVLTGEMTPIKGKLAESYAEIDLSFATLPTCEELSVQAASSDKYQAARAKMLLAQIAAGHPLSPTYPYPVQVWRLGNGPVFVTLGGEVVVDFALRLEQEYPNERMWVAGYTNDVMAYIPSRRVLAEGGYEGGGAMVYYGLPTAWAPDVEEKIIREVHRQVDKP